MQADVCVTCGSMLGISTRQHLYGRRVPVCVFCPGGKGKIAKVSVPFVFRYLCNELAAMNIRLQLVVRDAFDVT